MKRASLGLPATLALLLAAPGLLAAPAGQELESARYSTRIRGLSADVAGLILTGQPGGDLRLRLLAQVLPTEPLPTDSTPQVAVVVEVSGADLLQGFDGDQLDLEIYAYALKGEGGVAAYVAETLSVRTEDLREAVSNKGVKFFAALRLQPGDYTFRVLIRGSLLGRTGLAEHPLTVPENPAESILVVFPEPSNRDSWIDFRQATGPGVSTADGFTLASDHFALAAQPVLVAGKNVSLLLFGSGLPETKARCQVRLRARPAAGSAAFEAVDCRVSPEASPAAGGLEARHLHFRAPRLPAGEYLLEVALLDRPRLGGGSGSRSSQPIAVLLLDRRTQERGLLWTDLRAPLTADEHPTSKTTAKDRRRLQTRYRAALTELATGSASQAHTAVFELESTIIGSPSQESHANLIAAENTVASDLSALSPELLVPLFTLHTRLYRDYVERKLFSLAAHSKAIVPRLVETYTAAGGSQQVASRVLASLGGHLLDANLPASSRTLFQRALGHNPKEHAALLGLASMLEKFGEPRAAVRVLRDLVALHPDETEAPLRLGVTLCRVGNGREGREVLDRLLDSPAPDWIHSLASETLARSLLEAQRLEEAASVLEGAVAVLPPPLRPYLLQALVYDRLGRPSEAISVVQRRVFYRAEEQPSPRMIYDSWPQDSLQRLRDSLDSLATAQHADLGRALASAAR